MRLDPYGLALALLAAALWGLAPVAIKGALEGYSPEIINPVRLGIAALFFRAAGGRGTPWLPTDYWSWLGGLALGVDFVLYNYGLERTTAAVSGWSSTSKSCRPLRSPSGYSMRNSMCAASSARC